MLPHMITARSAMPGEQHMLGKSSTIAAAAALVIITTMIFTPGQFSKIGTKKSTWHVKGGGILSTQILAEGSLFLSRAFCSHFFFGDGMWMDVSGHLIHCWFTAKETILEFEWMGVEGEGVFLFY